MTIGIALSGGGAKAFAHLGVLKALEEEGIKPDIISGVSAGSIVGVFMAAGKSPDEILALVKDNKFFDYAKVALPSSGLLTLKNFEKTLKKLLPARAFDDLNLPLHVAVSNLYSGRVEYISSGELVTVILASCSIPVLFSPVEMNGVLYADGGMFDNLPYRPLVGQCDKIIAVNIVAQHEIDHIGSMVDVGTRVFELVVNRGREDAMEICDLLIEPDGMDQFGILDTRHGEELFKRGYDYCKNNIDLSRIRG